ncbi:hypothetical protein PMAYCL1PPCAC_13815, partial [Pristionchus mayeri]
SGWKDHLDRVHSTTFKKIGYVIRCECGRESCSYRWHSNECQNSSFTLIQKGTKTNPYSCSECSQKFAKKAALDYHMLTHSGDKPFKCPHCDLSFRSLSQRSR